jgi:hypothetical protein
MSDSIVRATSREPNAAQDQRGLASSVSSSVSCTIVTSQTRQSQNVFGRGSTLVARPLQRACSLVGHAGVLAAILPVEEEVGDIGTVNAAIEVEVCGAAGSVLDP